MTEKALDNWDDILGVDSSEGSKIQPVIESNVVSKVVSAVVQPTAKMPTVKIDEDINSDDLPTLIGTDYPAEYLKVVERIKSQYQLLPQIDYDAIYKEISELSICSAPAPTLQVINDELQRVQAAKDRLSEILIDVIRTYNFKNRAVDILKDSWGKFTTEKNTEGRKGDATFRLSDFMCDFAQLEALSKACNHIFKNLDSLHDNLSRRITVWQLILKLRDVGRGALPDFDFAKQGSGEIDLFGEGSKGESDMANGEPKARNFEE